MLVTADLGEIPHESNSHMSRACHRTLSERAAIILQYTFWYHIVFRDRRLYPLLATIRFPSTTFSKTPSKEAAVDHHFTTESDRVRLTFFIEIQEASLINQNITLRTSAVSLT
jgi:hypothetical protein